MGDDCNGSIVLLCVLFLPLWGGKCEEAVGFCSGYLELPGTKY